MKTAPATGAAALLRGAPTTSVLPESANENPKPSPRLVRGSANLDTCWNGADRSKNLRDPPFEPAASPDSPTIIHLSVSSTVVSAKLFSAKTALPDTTV